MITHLSLVSGDVSQLLIAQHLSLFLRFLDELLREVSVNHHSILNTLENRHKQYLMLVVHINVIDGRILIEFVIKLKK